MEENFNLERQLLDDLQRALADTSGKAMPIFELSTAMVNLGINSLSFLEGIQLVCDKYQVSVNHEELAGSLIIGRIEKILENKVLEKYSGDLERIKQIANEVELNLVGENITKIPGPFAINLAKKIIERGPQ